MPCRIILGARSRNTSRSVLAFGFAGPPNSSAQEIPPPGDPVPVERLVLRFAAGQISLVERHAMRKVLPPSDELPDSETLTGFWYEVRAADGSVRYRRIIGDPIRLVFEGPEPDAAPGAPASRQEAIPAERVFTLLIPQAQPGDQLVLFSSPLEPGAQGEPATDIARIDLSPIIPD